MNQWASRHPELYEEGIRYEDFHDPDRVRMEIKDGVRPDPRKEAEKKEEK